MQSSVTKERSRRKKSDDISRVGAPVRRTNKDHLSMGIKVTPLNESQRQMMFALSQNMNVVAYGSAGTGKSYLACHYALEKLLDHKIGKIIIVRSAVETRSQGFLPGSISEKSEPYSIPYKQIINQLTQNGTSWDILTKKEMVEFITTSYIRGITLDDCVVIVDEAQNMNWGEWNSLITRAGKNCQLIICGDVKQTDLLYKKGDVSGMHDALKVIRNLPTYFDMIEFRPNDIVRSDLVKAWIIECEKVL